jgi:hypothetical protein
MAINPQLIEWLKPVIDLNGDNYIQVDDEENSFYMAMVTEARLLNWIAFERYRNGVITYRLTALGEIALGIPATSTPVSEDSGAYTAQRKEWATGEGYYIANANGESVSDMWADESLADGMLRTLNTETAALRSQLAAVTSERDAMKARVAELGAENAVLGIVISSVGIKVHDARDLLFDEKYAAADGELKNAEVIIRANRGNDATD